MSDSVRPHRRQPTRLPHPWDSPGKNTGVGCHFLLQCMKVKVKSLSCVRLFVTPWTAAYQAPLSMGFFRQESGVGCHCLFQGLVWVTSKNMAELICYFQYQIISTTAFFSCFLSQGLLALGKVTCHVKGCSGFLMERPTWQRTEELGSKAH